MKRVSRGGAKAPGLMLTPLLDMFTIILIFLIVSFNAEDYDFKLDEGLTLPESSARSPFKPSINLSARQTGVLVEEELVVAFEGGKAAEEFYQAGEIPKLVTLLSRYYDDLHVGAPPEAGGEAAEPVEVDENTMIGPDEVVITIQADKRLEYKTLYLIMRSAAKAGFFKYRLAVYRT
jgi:biopolymer transport protein ExbD